MARVIIVTDKRIRSLLVFSSVKKVCQKYNLSYRDVGNKLRGSGETEIGDIIITRKKVI